MSKLENEVRILAALVERYQDDLNKKDDDISLYKDDFKSFRKEAVELQKLVMQRELEIEELKESRSRIILYYEEKITALQKD